MLIIKCMFLSVLLFLTLTKQWVSGNDVIEHDYIKHHKAAMSKKYGASRDIDEELCELQRDASPSLTNILLDATGKINSGLMIGNVNSFGQYRQCLSVDEIVDDVHVRAKYCMASMFIRTDLPENGIEDANSLSHLTRSVSAGMSMSGLVGICVPSACNSTTFYDASILDILGMDITLQELFCREKNDKPFAAHDIVAVVIFSILGLILTLSTIYHCYNIFFRNDKDIPKILKSFSVHHNMCRLLKISKGSNLLSCINGVRAISMGWIVLGHAYQTSLLMTPLENFSDVLEWRTQFRSTFISTAALGVDTFLYMTAFLLTWSVLQKFKRAGDFAKAVPMLYLNRYIRLTPLMAAVILLQVSFFNHVTDGPDWRLVSSSVDSCLNNWWVNFLYVQNYVRTYRGMCLSHSWYLALDMQLYFASPIVIIFLFADMKLAFAAIAVAVCAALGATIGIAFYHNITDFATDMNIFYHNTLARASPFVFGIMIGYVMFLCKQRGIKFTSKPYMVVHWIISAGLIIAAFVGTHSMSNNDPSQTLVNIFLAWHRPAWALGVGGLIFACVHGFGGPINWFLSLNLWTIPARLSYGIYLIHYPIQFAIAAASHSPFRFTNGDVVMQFISVFVISLVASVVLTMLVEAPFAELSNILFAKLLGKKKSSDSEQKPKDVEELRDDTEVAKEIENK